MVETINLDALLAQVHACRHCEANLPLGPLPVLRASSTARLLIIGQAPGTRAHETHLPWNDPSGDRLRHWLNMDRDAFYDARRIAIIPMGFCYPGRDPRGGDNPPRPECAPLWHPCLLDALPNIRLTLLVGSYAQARYLEKTRARTLTETVRRWQTHLPTHFPLPHPSWRNTHWLRKNPWFETELVPDLQHRVGQILA